MQKTGANYTGKQLERFINERLTEKGYTFVPNARFQAAAYLEQPIYSRQCTICKSIFETDVHCDFIIFHPEKHPDGLVIEAKWQQSSGSAEDKLPYTVRNIHDCYPHKTILLLDGGGFRKQTEAWVRKQVGGNLLHVFNMTEFQRWANKGGI